MRWLADIWFRLRALFGRATMERELEEEIAFHLEREAEKYRSRGVSPAEAHRLARVKFGGEDRFKDHARESWGVTLAHDLGGDVRFAGRQLRKHPAFTALAAVTLALGIGGTIALFSVVHALLIRPLPLADEDRLVTWWMDYNWRGAEFDHVREVVLGYESLAAYSRDAYTLRTDAGSSLHLATVSSVELFEVLGVAPLLGRTFREGEDRPGSEPVAVLTHGLWQREFGGDPEIVGRRIVLAGEPTTIVGVMPETFYFPTPEMELFVPLDLDPDSQQYRGNGWLVITGKLREGWTQARVDDDLARVVTALDERWEYPDAWDKTRDAHVVPMREYLLGDVRPALLLLLGAVGLVLLMACTNVAALILTRSSDRTGEISVRAALGAGRARLARQILTESVLLGVVSGVLGMGLAVALFDVVVASLPLPSELGSTLSLDWTALMGSLGLAVVTGSLVALAPMRSLLRGEPAGAALGTRSQAGTSAGKGRLQSTLVVAEVLLAVVLATGATLLVRTVGELRSLDPGLESEGVLTVSILGPEQDSDPELTAQFFDALLERTAALPGVQDVGLINRVPMRDTGGQATVEVEDRPDLTGDQRPNAFYRVVTPRTFGALRAELVRGRSIEATDTRETPRVAVVNEAFARTLWGDDDPLGRHITRNGSTTDPIRVVGVVRDIAVEDLVGAVPSAAYYSWDQAMRGSPFGNLVIRSELDEAALADPIRRLVAELDPRVAIGRVQTMDQIVDAAMAEPLRLRFFLGLFSALGILLGTVGVYGVVSYAVQRRRAEFGIRMALGAEPGTLVGDVVRAGMVPVALGVLGGTAVALVATSWLARFLFGVSPTDPVSLAAAGGALLAAGAIAAWIPAWRASRTDPATALRAE